jgi:hypothetical protein
VELTPSSKKTAAEITQKLKAAILSTILGSGQQSKTTTKSDLHKKSSSFKWKKHSSDDDDVQLSNCNTKCIKKVDSFNLHEFMIEE